MSTTQYDDGLTIDQNDYIDIIKPDDIEATKRKLYFINEVVEDKLRLYIWGSCTDIELRDSIMSHADELIKQMIRKQNLHTIYPGQEESTFGDLVQTAWVQIERTLYKFRARPYCRTCYNADRPNDSVLYTPAQSEYGIIQYNELFKYLNSKKCPHCGGKLNTYPLVTPRQGVFGGSVTILFRGSSKVFNMWSQIARTVILAFVKKEGRDKKNATSYKSHLRNKKTLNEDNLIRFFEEAESICEYNSNFMLCIKALKTIARTDDRPHEGLTSKLIEHTKLPRSQVMNFIRMLRLRSQELSDSPLNRRYSANYGRQKHKIDEEEEN